MAKMSAPIIRLIGKLRLRGTDWNLAEYRSLFKRLESIAEAGKITRYIRYSGEINGRTLMRFFGVESDSSNIPRGLVAVELGKNTIDIVEPGQKGWRGNLHWNWQDRSVKNAPLGEFKAQIPDDWITRPIASSVDFIITANAYFQKGKSANDDVRLVEYDPTWPEQFKKTAALLRKIIPPGIVTRIEHFGSTAVPGMPAKPVLDILLGISSFEKARKALIPVFNKQECEYWWQEDHLMFIVRDKFLGTRTHHIHAAPAGGFWERVAFRDYLCMHKEDAKRYAALKYKLAASHAKDRELYTAAKSAFVREITTKALRHV